MSPYSSKILDNSPFTFGPAFFTISLLISSTVFVSFIGPDSFNIWRFSPSIRPCAVPAQVLIFVLLVIRFCVTSSKSAGRITIKYTGILSFVAILNVSSNEINSIFLSCGLLNLDPELFKIVAGWAKECETLAESCKQLVGTKGFTSPGGSSNVLVGLGAHVRLLV